LHWVFFYRFYKCNATLIDIKSTFVEHVIKTLPVVICKEVFSNVTMKYMLGKNGQGGELWLLFISAYSALVTRLIAKNF
jgi:hypothetical protein